MKSISVNFSNTACTGTEFAEKPIGRAFFFCPELLHSAENMQHCSHNRPSHDDAPIYVDKSITLLRKAGFDKICFRGDTDFTQTKHLDRWDEEGVFFVFGIDARPNLIDIAESLEKREERARKERSLKMEFRTFLQAMIHLPVQIIWSGGQRVVRLLNLNKSIPKRAKTVAHQPLKCLKCMGY